MTFRPITRAFAGAAILAVALSLGACSASPEPKAAPTPTVKATSEATPTPTPSPVAAEKAISPLRGTEVDPAAITGPALSAKIDNHAGARPQIGLNQTDIVFEELVEGGMTRYVAVWFSDVPAEIGPVRSIRPMDPDIISPLGGVVAYSGGQQRFVNMMMDAPVHNAIHGGADDRFMHRTRAKAAPHNVIVAAQELRAAYAQIPPPAPQFAYSLRPQTASAVAFGRPSPGVDVSFSDTSHRTWRWDAASSRYLRGQNGVADVDSTGAQLGATNVVVIGVAIDWTYGDIPKTVMIGSGPAWVSSGGAVVEGTWEKASRDAPVTLKNARGGPINLAPGSTWVELMPTGWGGAVGVL